VDAERLGDLARHPGDAASAWASLPSVRTLKMSRLKQVESIARYHAGLVERQEEVSVLRGG
jgi:hypothetical protein